MFKSKIFATVAFAFVCAAVVSTLSVAKVAYAAGDDVFVDEGDGDFDAVPAAEPVAEAPHKKENTAVAKVAEPPAALPAAADADDSKIPMLSDDGQPAAMPAAAETAPVEKKKSSKKKKKEVLAAVEEPASPSLSLDPEAAPAPEKKHAKKSAGGGSFVVTKDACPMMRSPASTGETMLTVKAQKKIWVEDAGSGWVKAFNKAGEPGYVSKDCVD